MKKSTINSAPLYSHITISCLLFVMLALNEGCQKIKPDTVLNTTSENESYAQSAGDGLLTPRLHPYRRDLSKFSDTLRLNELVVWLKPGKTEKDFKKWLDSVKNKVGSGRPINVTYCEGCDSSLRLLTGSGIVTYVQGNTVSGGQSANPPVKTNNTGDDGPVYHVRNFPVSFSNPKLSFTSVAKLPAAVYGSKTVVKVAVMDTGLEPGELDQSFLYKPADSSCIQGAGKGWNFVANNPNFSDDDPERHGTTVTRFITGQAVLYKQNPVQILPVKTQDANGSGDLFTVLCAFAYAKERQVNIINASFGFYEPRLEMYGYKQDGNVTLLKEYVKHYLTDNNILLIAAAGNKDDVNEKKAFDDHGIPYPPAPRNLDFVNFFPASLSRDPAFTNVIAVTTVDSALGKVSPIQNFSRNVVDIGTNDDAIVSGQYVFNNPRFKGNGTVEGSSFATPVMTGKLAANYDLIKGVLNNKSAMWTALGSDIIHTNASLSSKIKNGQVITKLK